MPPQTTQTTRVQLSPVSVGEAYAVFGASFSGPDVLREAFEAEVAAIVNELDPQQIRYDWGTFKKFDASSPQALASWIEDNLFVKNGTKVIKAEPVPPSTASGLYCIFTDPDTGREYQVCYGTFTLTDDETGAEVLVSVNDGSQSFESPLGITFAFGIEIP
ncbi:MAG: hypothetical protein V3T53_01730 [Phycisphaerales bacterium]